jgi:hypothetical protein
MNQRAKRQQAAIAALRSLEPQQGQIRSARNDDEVRVIYRSRQMHEAFIRQVEGREPTAADRVRHVYVDT